MYDDSISGARKEMAEKFLMYMEPIHVSNVEQKYKNLLEKLKREYGEVDSWTDDQKKFFNRVSNGYVTYEDVVHDLVSKRMLMRFGEEPKHYVLTEKGEEAQEAGSIEVYFAVKREKDKRLDEAQALDIKKKKQDLNNGSRQLWLPFIGVLIGGLISTFGTYKITQANINQQERQSLRDYHRVNYIDGRRLAFQYENGIKDAFVLYLESYYNKHENNRHALLSNVQKEYIKQAARIDSISDQLSFVIGPNQTKANDSLIGFLFNTLYDTSAFFDSKKTAIIDIQDEFKSRDSIWSMSTNKRLDSMKLLIEPQIKKPS